MRIPLAREAGPFLVPCLLAVGGSLFWAGSGGWGLRWGVPAGLAGLTLFVAYFFRDPDRRTPSDENLVVSPADGRIVGVGAAEGEAFMGGTAIRVSIFLSVFNVHVQRAPFAGRTSHYDYRPGGYAPAWRDAASRENERASLGIATASGPILVRQIAGWVARRIATYPREGDTLARGERIGLIRFGSRVDLFLPADWPVTVRPGDFVRGGETEVARAPLVKPSEEGDSP